MINVLVMAGGQGLRLWPLSRLSRPKQFLKLIDNNKTLLQQTVKRISNLVHSEQIYLSTLVQYQEMIHQQLPEIPPENIIIEPCRKNTAPTIGLATLYIQQKRVDSTMIILPADHLITDAKILVNSLKKAVQLAESGPNLVALGIKPDYPETRYGYILTREATETINMQKAVRIKTFIEKPDSLKAEALIREESCFWNSGIYIWKPESILEYFKLFLPELYFRLERIRKALGTKWELQTISHEYQRMPAISIDRGIMEKSIKNRFVIPVNMEWLDLGNWLALEKITHKDSNNNTILGKHRSVDTVNSIIYSPLRLTATVGLKDVIIVDTDDIILVCNKSRLKDIKHLYSILKEEGLTEYL